MYTCLFISTGISDAIVSETNQLSESSSKESDENSKKNYTPNFNLQKEENNNVIFFDNNDDNYVSAESCNISLEKTDVKNAKLSNLNEQNNVKNANLNIDASFITNGDQTNIFNKDDKKKEQNFNNNIVEKCNKIYNDNNQIETENNKKNESINNCDYIFDDNYKVQNKNIYDENLSRMLRKRGTSDMLLNCMEKKQKIDVKVLELNNLKLASQLGTEVDKLDNIEDEKKNAQKTEENKIKEFYDHKVGIQNGYSLLENSTICDEKNSLDTGNFQEKIPKNYILKNEEENEDSAKKEKDETNIIENDLNTIVNENAKNYINNYNRINEICNNIKESNAEDAQNSAIVQNSINIIQNDKSFLNIKSSTTCIANTMLSFYDSINWEAEHKTIDVENDNHKYTIDSEDDPNSVNFNEVENAWNLNTQSSFHTNNINTSLNKDVIVISNSDEENKKKIKEINNEKNEFEQITQISNNIDFNNDKKITSYFEQCNNNKTIENFENKNVNPHFNNIIKLNEISRMSKDIDANGEHIMTTNNLINNDNILDYHINNEHTYNANKKTIQSNNNKMVGDAPIDDNMNENVIMNKINNDNSTEVYKHKNNSLKEIDKNINNYNNEITIKEMSKNNINFDNQISIQNWNKDTINNNNEHSESDKTECTYEVGQLQNIINNNLNVCNSNCNNANADNNMFANNSNLLNSNEHNNIININKIDNQKYIDINDQNFDTIEDVTNFDNISEKEDIDDERNSFITIDHENDKYMQWFDTIYTVCVKLDELCCKLNSSFPHSMNIWNQSGKVNMHHLKSVFNINENWIDIYNQDCKKNKNDLLFDVNIQKNYNNPTCRDYNKNGMLNSNLSNDINNSEFHYNIKDSTIIDNKNNLLSNPNNINNCVNYFPEKNNYSKVGINSYINEYSTEVYNNNNNNNLAGYDNEYTKIDKQSKDNLVHLDNGLICKNRNNKNVNENNNVNMNPSKNSGIINNNVKMSQMYGNENNIKNALYYQNKQYGIGSNLENNKIPINSNNGNMNSILNLPSNNICNINNMGSNLVDNMCSIYGNLTNSMNNKNNINMHRYNNEMVNYMNLNNVHNIYNNNNDGGNVNPEMCGKKIKNSKKNSNNVINKNTEKNNNKKRNSVNRSNNRVIKDESEFEYLLELPDKDGPNLENPEDLRCDIAGVYWDKRSWIASWYDNGKRYYKSFSAKTHGFYKSKFWAIKVRLSKVKGQTIFGKHNRKPVMLPTY